MARSGYGRVGGGRRSSAAIWQWMILGIVMGFSCAAVMVLALLTVGLLNIDEDGLETAQEVTNTPFIVVASPDPNLPTQTPFIITASPEPITEEPVENVQVAPPTATIPPEDTPVPENTNTPEPLPTADTVQQTGGINDGTSQQAGSGNNAPSEIPPLLAPLISDVVPVDGGTFQMGTSAQEVALAVEECVTRDGGACQISYGEDSIPTHGVTLDPFFIERTEVTNRQYVAFLNSQGAGSHLTGCSNTKCIDTQRENEFSVIVFDSANYSVPDIFADFPASGVTWYGARAYCEAIGRRLPTEAEWERAARGPNNLLYPWGDLWDGTRAAVRIPAEGDVGAGPVQINTLNNASGYGAVDMAGNAAEWVNDFYQADYYLQQAPSAVNPQGPLSGRERVLRGGSWNTPPFFTRSVHRQAFAPDNSFLWMGFRCADDVEETATSNEVDPLDLGGEVGSAPENTTTNQQNTQGGAAPTLPPRATAVGDPTEVPALPPDPGEGG